MQQEPIERVAYRLCVEAATKRRNLSMVDMTHPPSSAAYATSYGTYTAERASQQMFSCGVFEAFDVYFRVAPLQAPSQAVGSIRLSKRVTMLPASELNESFEHPLLEGARDIITRLFTKHMQPNQKGMPVPVITGPAGSQDLQMMVVPKGTCTWCGAARSDSTMKCSCGCAYCSKACQKQHWHQHRQMEH